MIRLIEEYGTALCERDRRRGPQDATAKCRGVRRAEGGWLPFGGRQAGVYFRGGSWCADGLSGHNGCHKQNVQYHPV
ncbi:MAG: hypothetical protein HN341_10040 [Verrucomicrobia bacterium]|nr:hypothetical protein [Verrucomicrobiota bacterium]